MNLTEREKRCLVFLSDKDFTSPTIIGGLFGADSSTGSPICKSLVRKGLLIRNNRGWYKILTKGE